MAGHSKFKNIMYRKGAQDKKRAKIFTKVIREIMVAARSGMADSDFNPRLRAAIALAREVNMPKDRVENAIKKATSSAEGSNYEEIRYEGYGPHGAALIIETLTDNRNRTAGNIRAAFSKHGGSLVETGSVSYLFQRLGLLVYGMQGMQAEEQDRAMEAALEAGAVDCIFAEEGCEILCTAKDFNNMREALEQKLGMPTVAKLIWKPQTEIALGEDDMKKLVKLIDFLEDHDDVQSVTGNFTIPDELYED